MSGTALKRVLVILFILCSNQFHLSAQGKNFSISKKTPSWIVNIATDDHPKTPIDVSDGYYLSHFENQNQVELHEDYTHIIRQIVSDAGVQNGSEITVTYDPSYQKLTFHKITVWRNNHPQDRLDGSKFKVLQNEKDLSKFIYSGTFDAYTILDDIRKGDQIEYSYTIQGDNPVFGNRYSTDFYFESSSSVCYWYINLIAKQNRLLNFKSFNGQTSPKTSVKNGLKIYEWQNKNTKGHVSADYEPNWYNSYKHTQVSEYQNWAEIVEWGLKTNNYLDLKTPLLDQKVKEFQHQANNDTKKYIELATRFVQDEIRYMGIEMGQYSHRPNSPEKVFIQRYGDCKDKSLLLVYLLKKANIDAHMAYVDTYYGKELNEFLPSPTLFNHVVVVVEFKNVKTWIDPTISYQRGSFESIYFPNYGKALVLKQGNNKPEDVISIPTGKLVADLTFVVSDTTKSASTTLIIKSTYTDNYADKIRGEIAENGLDGTEKSYLEYITKYYPDIETSAKIQIKDNENANIFEIIETYRIKNFWLKEEKSPFRYYVYFYGDLIDENIRSIKTRGRTAPIALKYPVNIEQNVFITLPFVPNSQNENRTIETDDYFFEFTSLQHGKNITLNYAYRSSNDHVATENIDKYVKDFKKINHLLSYNITFGNSNAGNDLNPYAIIAAIAALLISGFFFFKLFRLAAPFAIEKMADAKPIGGWIILLGLGLTVSPIKLLINLYQSNLFSLSLWNAFENQSTLFIYLTRTGYTLEIMANMVQLTGLFLMIGLFYGRRIEFIKLCRVYFMFNISIMIFDLLLGVFIATFAQTSLEKMAILSQLAPEVGRSIYSIIISTVWILYLRKSERVKETFVFTYPKASWTDQLSLFKNEQLASYYKNINVYGQSNRNNDYLSGISLKKDNNNTIEDQQAQDPASTGTIKSADDNKKSNNEDL